MLIDIKIRQYYKNDDKNDDFPFILSVSWIWISARFPETCGLLKQLAKEEMIFITLFCTLKLDVIES